MILIVKPGEDSNRGNGIEICTEFYELRKILNAKETHTSGKEKTFIVQQYIDKPFLYNKRKFDIRCYMLVTHYNKMVKAYWYSEGYIRTSSKEFNKSNISDKLIHLTNDAV
jgi:glutathione synthase/RimK-type ligase-like ATP-grasp enzyme